MVGAGLARCVLAARLSERPSLRVLLIEAGPPDASPFSHMPKGFRRLLYDPDLTWRYKTEAEGAFPRSTGCAAARSAAPTR